MNLRRRSLRGKLSKLKSSPVKKLLKKKLNRSRDPCTVSKLDDLRNSSRKTFGEIANDFDSKPLLSCKKSKHSNHTKDDLHVSSSVDSCDDPLKRNSFNSIKHQSIKNLRKRKSTQQNNSLQNILEVKKRKKNRSTKGKEASNSSSVSKSTDKHLGDLKLEVPNTIYSKRNKITNHDKRRISEKNTTESNEKSDISLKNTMRTSPRLAAKKKIEDKEIGQNTVSIKNDKTKIFNSKSSNNLPYKAKEKRFKKMNITPKNSGINEKPTDEASVCSEAKTDDTITQIKKKENSKITSEFNQSKLHFRSNSSQYELRQLGKKINLCDNNLGDSFNNSLYNHSKTLSRLRPEQRHSGRHTVPLRKKTKKLLQRKTDVTKNSSTPLKLSSQINEFSYYLNNIPTDDLAKIPFYSPKYVSKMKQSIVGKQGIIMTSTPHFKKSTKQQLSKKKNKKIDDCYASKKRAPSKGSLKRKRQLINSLKEKYDGYEDDIYENCSFGNFNKMFELDADSDTSAASIATPKCSFLVTSCLPKKSPRFKDCYSPQELLKARKVAEEYMYRRNKKWKKTLKSTPNLKKDEFGEPESNIKTLGSIASIPEKKGLDFMSVIKQHNEKMEDLENESDEDYYFSD